MTTRPRIGLLPLYLALYDDALPQLRGELQPFLNEVTKAFTQHGIEVEVAPVCCVHSEFETATQRFNDKQVDLIVTLHLAYSPSLESIDALTATEQPLLLFDTTPDEAFGQGVDPQRLLYNHGIHGVQDLAVMLRRRGKDYWVVAGHLSDPKTMERAAGIVRAAHAARQLRKTRVLRIGPSFSGMGDFRVDESVLAERLGIHTDEIEALDLADDAAQVTDADVAAEVARDLESFEADLEAGVHERSVRLGLGLRRYLERGDYSAFGMNFLAFVSHDAPLCTVPFLECCKAMARGMGYAGEGDVLTASLVAALASGWGNTSFTEIFCPDWQGETLFISHMGEFNPVIAAGKPRLYEKKFPFTPAQNPAALACAPRPGPATLVNLAPGPNDTFRLIIAPVEILEDGTHPDLREWLRGWLRPSVPVAEFLERYSQLGGTHHSALMLGDHREALAAFARMVGMEACLLAQKENAPC